MVLIRKITQLDRRGGPHVEVECTYWLKAGSYLTLETYGRSERRHPETVSQTMQFDLQGATRLKELIEEAFPSLKRGSS
jgi:hypothetical protein